MVKRRSIQVVACHSLVHFPSSDAHASRQFYAHELKYVLAVLFYASINTRQCGTAYSFVKPGPIGG
jgi:hypothetical protein